jgi:ketosteroid isomerase-like protein
MTFDNDNTRIAAVLDAVREGHRRKDAAAVGARFDAAAVVFDLAPPLAHGVDVAGLATWFDKWEGPVEIDERDLKIIVSGDLGVCYGLQKVAAVTGEGENAEWWQRLTVCLARTDGEWKIVHEHTSVPFHMDGSFRAAVDLEP